MFKLPAILLAILLETLPAILLGVDACISRNFRTCCWKLAQFGWVSNTVASNVAGNIARCGCPLKEDFNKFVA